jgi:hypothetical protein
VQVKDSSSHVPKVSLSSVMHDESTVADLVASQGSKTPDDAAPNNLNRFSAYTSAIKETDKLRADDIVKETAARERWRDVEKVVRQVLLLMFRTHCAWLNR